MTRFEKKSNISKLVSHSNEVIDFTNVLIKEEREIDCVFPIVVDINCHRSEQPLNGSIVFHNNENFLNEETPEVTRFVSTEQQIHKELSRMDEDPLEEKLHLPNLSSIESESEFSDQAFCCKNEDYDMETCPEKKIKAQELEELLLHEEIEIKLENEISTKSGDVRKQPLKAKNRKLFAYSNDAIEAALRAVRESGVSIREASRRFGVPRATIHDKLTGKSLALKQKTGPPPILTVEGETKIADWAANLAKCGFPISKSQLMETVTKIAVDTGKIGAFPNGGPGVKWYKAFLKRHPELSQKEAEGSHKAQASITKDLIQSWFEDLRRYLRDNNFEDVLEDPTRVFNGDECKFYFCLKTGKVLGPKGYKDLHTIKLTKNKENITVFVVFNASGKICPPLVVFPYISPPRAVIENMPDNWVIGKSDLGWIKGNVFYQYISNEFNSWLTKNEIKRPIILFIDSNQSRMALPLSQFCKQHGIVLYAVPPNTTHILRPAEFSVFKPLKLDWENTVKDWQRRPENGKHVITTINFCKVFQETLQKTQMENDIVKGFRKCGLYPLKPDRVDYAKCVKDTPEKLLQNQVSIDCEQLLSTNDFDSAEKVIKKISDELEKRGINSNIVINEINLARKSLVIDSDKMQRSTLGS